MCCLAKKGLRVGSSPPRGGSRVGAGGIRHIFPCEGRVKAVLVPFWVGVGGGTHSQGSSAMGSAINNRSRSVYKALAGFRVNIQEL